MLAYVDRIDLPSQSLHCQTPIKKLKSLLPNSELGSVSAETSSKTMTSNMTAT